MEAPPPVAASPALAKAWSDPLADALLAARSGGSAGDAGAEARRSDALDAFAKHVRTNIAALVERTAVNDKTNQ